MGSFTQDLRAAVRSLARRKGPAAVVILTLALGLGLTSAVFSVVHAVLLRAIPFSEPDRLVEVGGLRREGTEVEDWVVSYPDFADWHARRSEAGLAELAAHSGARSFNLVEGGEPEHLEGEMVSAGYFRVLDVKPILGRTFTAEEDAPGAARLVAVLSHDLWMGRFAGDRAILGRALSLDGQTWEVVGVMPAGFRGMTDAARIWLPVTAAGEVLGPHYVERRRFRWLQAVGRLAPGASAARAQEGLDRIASALAQEYPESNEGIGARVTPLTEAWIGDLRRSLLTLLGASAFVLLIACANVSALLLARAVERRREVAVRAALGAGRGRLVRQTLAESLLLALAGCALGLTFAHWITSALSVAGSLGLRSFVRIGVNPAVAGAGVAAALVCGLLIGLVPALTASRTDLVTDLKAGAKGSEGLGRRRFQSFLVLAEVALSMALLVGAGLMIRGFQKYRDTDLGFRPRQLLTLRADLKDRRYARDEAVHALVREALERAAGLPGVEAVSFAGPALPTDSGLGASFTIEDRHDPEEDGNILLWTSHVTPGYFATLSIPLLEGRDFGPQDAASAEPWSVVISETATRRYWPGRSPLGRRLTIGTRADHRLPWFTVIGVVGDVRGGGLSPEAEENEPAAVYFAMLQFPPKSPPMVNLLVRPAAGSDPLLLVEPLRRELRQIDPLLPLFDVATMEERLAGQTARPRLLVRLMSLYATLAAILAALGIYGAIAYAVTRRTREIGVHLALGADRGQVVRRMVWLGMVPALAGLAAGLGLAVTLSRLLAHLLYGVSPFDPWTFTATAALLFGVTLLAGYVPARRAARVEPTVALRAE